MRLALKPQPLIAPTPHVDPSAQRYSIRATRRKDLARPPKHDTSILPKLERRGRARRPLILPRLLRDEAHGLTDAEDIQRAHEIIRKWADLERDGHLRRKETALDAAFLAEVFGEALGYSMATQSPQQYQLERNFTVPGVGTADGAIGEFTPGATPTLAAVIELKSADVDLDRDRSQGRTPVQQCWDYLNALPECPWGIVSNFSVTRLYHRNRTPLAYEEFRLDELRDPRRFREFYCLLQRQGMLPSRLHRVPRALRLLEQSEKRQREVGDELYERYNEHRLSLINHLHRGLDKPVDVAIRIAQRILDRIIFIAFCEDRGLLNPETIDKAHSQVFPFAKVTNPRWRNFLELFRAMDTGHEQLELRTGYNGGLFREDPEVDDLQLDDDWTDFFREVGKYDFRDEVNVDVLGHLFEKSITELEKLRHSGFFESAESEKRARGRMQKSALRKRFGVYYTPPEFTRFLVDQTAGTLLAERFAAAAARHGVDAQAAPGEGTDKTWAAYWRDCRDIAQALTVCDPACGSGAFLIQAYDLLEEQYARIADGLAACGDERAAEELTEHAADIILNQNLFGVDLSPEAVEITQLALWIRSARRGRTLADLSRNIVCGNSLIDDPAVDPAALRWEEAFPQVFQGERPRGFDCVVGNPPWERMKLQEREFFSLSDPAIASAVSAATRRQLIAKLEKKQPDLYGRYLAAKDRADRALAYARGSGRYPLTGKGDINTYMLFAELARTIVAPDGRVGLLVPSGVATDDTTKEFFQELMSQRELVLLYDFENRRKVFPDVDGRFKFCTLVLQGCTHDQGTTTSPRQNIQADFVFFAHRFDEVASHERHIPLTAEDIALVNPNTRTCPIFRSRRDAEITKGVYRRIPILIDENRKEGGNPWGIRFFTMFHQTNDAELFHTAEQLKDMGFRRDGNQWKKGKQRYLPLYEAKMVQAYDHRAASVVVEDENWMRQGQTAETSLVQHQNPEFLTIPRWWVDEGEVTLSLRDGSRPNFLGFKDITSATNQRTMIAAAIPWSGVTNHFPLVLTRQGPRLEMCLLGNLNSFALDYAARQKVGGVTLNFFIVEQFPMLPPDAYAERCPWSKRETLEKWVSERVLKLTCTANDMIPLAEAAGFEERVHKWNPAERARLMDELDAAYFILYGLERDDVEYILGTFQGLRGGPPINPGERTRQTVLAAYDRLRGR